MQNFRRRKGVCAQDDDYQWARVKYMSKTTTMEVSVELRSLLFMYH
jgi:hypothetical protein